MLNASKGEARVSLNVADAVLTPLAAEVRIRAYESCSENEMWNQSEGYFSTCCMTMKACRGLGYGWWIGWYAAMWMSGMGIGRREIVNVRNLKGPILYQKSSRNSGTKMRANLQKHN